MLKLTKRWDWSRQLTPIWIGYWLCLFLATHLPVPVDAPMIPRGGDKPIHFLLYFILTLLGGKRFLSHRKQFKLQGLLTWGLVYTAFALVDEWTQPWVGRTMSVYDWWADVAGIVVATCILKKYSRQISSGQAKAINA